MSVATEKETHLYVERFGDLWRWSLVHGGGPYPLLRVTARFLKVDYHAILIGHRQIDGRLSVFTRDPEKVIEPDSWAVVTFDGPATEATVTELIGSAPGLSVPLSGDRTG